MILQAGRDKPSWSEIMTAAHRHRYSGPAVAWIATLSDSRNNRTDTGGASIGALLEAAGHEVLGTSILREDENVLAAGLTSTRILTNDLCTPLLNAIHCRQSRVLYRNC